MTREQKTIRTLLARLKRAPLRRFPAQGGGLDAPHRQGVYLIYSPRGRVVHVGRTPRGARGIRQRLANYLHGASSFTIQFLNRKGWKGSKLRSGYAFRCLVIRNPRRRALLEAYATGCLCPAHLGLNLVGGTDVGRVRRLRRSRRTGRSR